MRSTLVFCFQSFCRLRVSASALLFGALLSTGAGLPASNAFAAAGSDAAPSSDTPVIRLKLRFRNIVGPNGEGRLSRGKGLALFREMNGIWSQCQVQFDLVQFANEQARTLEVPFPPQGMDDLSVTAQKLDPKGFRGAIPLTIAGPWSFVYGSVWLNGLGWVFTNAQGGVDRIGAMMSAKKTNAPEAGLILAHEIGHALSLPEGGDGTLMGPGTPVLSAAQCSQARGFAEKFLSEFRVQTAPEKLL